MIHMRYSSVRRAILAIGEAIFLFNFLFVVRIDGQMFCGLLIILTLMSYIIPPGIYGWLLHPVCPNCRQSVEWDAVQPAGRPHREQIILRCPGCSKARVEWQFSPA